MTIESVAVSLRREYISHLAGAVKSYLDHRDESGDDVSYRDYAEANDLPTLHSVTVGLGGWSNAVLLANSEMTPDDVINSGRVDIHQILPAILAAAEDGYTTSVGYSKWRARATNDAPQYPSRPTIYQCLGSWDAVTKILVEAGLVKDTRSGTNGVDRDMIEKMKRAIQINGEDKPYTIQVHSQIHDSGQVKDLPQYHVYIHSFGSWSHAVEAAGGFTGSSRFVSTSQGKDELARRILESMRTFVQDMKEQGVEVVGMEDYIEWYREREEADGEGADIFSRAYVYSNYPGGWVAAVRDAGGTLSEEYTPLRRSARFDDHDYIMKHVRRAAKAGNTTYRAYDAWRAERIAKGEEGIPSASTIRVKMNGWTTVLKQLRDEGFDIS